MNYCNSLKVPCQFCKERTVNCHATCQKYKNFATAIKKYNAECYKNKRLYKMTSPVDGTNRFY